MNKKCINCQKAKVLLAKILFQSLAKMINNYIKLCKIIISHKIELETCIINQVITTKLNVTVWINFLIDFMMKQVYKVSIWHKMNIIIRVNLIHLKILKRWKLTEIQNVSKLDSRVSHSVIFLFNNTYLKMV